MSPAIAGLATLLAQAGAGAPALPQQERLPAVSDPLLQAPAGAPETLASFDEALRRLRAGSDTLAIAAARADAAAAQSRQALAPLLPQLAGTASVNLDLLHPHDGPPVAGAGALGDGAGRGGPTSPLGVGTLAVAVPLVNVALWQARAAARAGADAAQASLADTQRVLVFQLASTLVNVAAAERTAELQREGLRQALEREYLVKRTRELGTGTGLDVVRAQQDTRLARADVIAGREQLLQAREALGLLLGTAAPVGVPAAELEEGAALEGAARRVCRTAPLEARPDVLAARLQLRAAEELVAGARADYLPTLSLQSSASVYTVDPGPLKVPSWLVAAVLAVPLWDGGGRGARLDERQANARAAGSDAEAVGREASVDRGRAARGVSVARDLLTEAQGARDLAREADRMTRRSFEVGVATSFELVQSAQALRQAELALAARAFQLVTARVAAVVSEATCNIM
jgi:multidrug efflux system outer membrane protein